MSLGRLCCHKRRKKDVLYKCTNEASGAWFTQLTFCVFFLQMNTKTSLINDIIGCLSCIFCSHQQRCQFVLYLWTDLVHKNKRFQEMPPCLADPCWNFRGKNPSIINIPPCLQISSSKNHHPPSPQNFKKHPWYGMDIFWKWKMWWMWMWCIVYLSLRPSSHEIWAFPNQHHYFPKKTTVMPLNPPHSSI